MYLLVIFLPLCGFFLAGGLGKFYGRFLSSFLIVFCIFISSILSLFLYYEICLCESVVALKLYDWVLIDLFQVSIGFLFDSLTCFMLIIIT